MSNQLDQRIREAMQRVVDEAPPPPDAPAPRPTSPAEPRRLPDWVAAPAVAAVVLLSVVIGALLLRMNGADGGDSAASSSTDGQTVSVTVSGVSGRIGHDLAGVLYEGGELTNLDGDAFGGFWSVIEDNDFTTTEVVRQPGEIGMGRFPFVTDEALTLEPGTYTLVIWVDHALNPATRWVPINTDGQGLYGCHAVFEVGNDTQTNIDVPANLYPDGWNTNCTTGTTIPGTDAASAVTP